MSKAVAIIPARGGSKRIPRKNIRDFLGKPIIAYSIEAALKSKLFEAVVVSTDDEEIAKVAKEYGAEVPFLRDKKLADDFVGSGEAVEWTVEKLKERGWVFDFVCTIYATAPLLKEEYLKEGYEKLKNSDAKMSFSVTTMPFPVQRTFKITKDNRCEMFYPEFFNYRSQDLEEAYQDAGVFYWERVDREFRDIPFGRDSMPVILPRYLVQDIDTLEDWKRAELMYRVLFPDKFDEWNEVKKSIDKKEPIAFYQGNIYFMSIGQNIGSESYGKDKHFLRPVLVYKKLSKTLFVGIPLTSVKKNGDFYFSFRYKQGVVSTAMLNQIRVFDIRRSKYLSGKINKNIYKSLQDRLKEFMRVTPSSKQGGMPTRAKSIDIVSKDKENVKL